MSSEPADTGLRLNKIGGAAYGATAVLILLMSAQEVKNAFLWLHDFSSSTSMFALGIAATAIATLRPFALSLWSWHLAGRTHRKWLAHLLFIPCAYAIFYAGASLLDFADGRPFTGEPADYALVAAFMLLGLAVLVHAAALVFEGVAAICRRRVTVR